jgi:hypothetical protein
MGGVPQPAPLLVLLASTDSFLLTRFKFALWLTGASAAAVLLLHAGWFITAAGGIHSGLHITTASSVCSSAEQHMTCCCISQLQAGVAQAASKTRGPLATQQHGILSLQHEE